MAVKMVGLYLYMYIVNHILLIFWNLLTSTCWYFKPGFMFFGISSVQFRSSVRSQRGPERHWKIMTFDTSSPWVGKNGKCSVTGLTHWFTRECPVLGCGFAIRTTCSHVHRSLQDTAAAAVCLVWLGVFLLPDGLPAKTEWVPYTSVWIRVHLLLDPLQFDLGCAGCPVSVWHLCKGTTGVLSWLCTGTGALRSLPLLLPSTRLAEGLDTWRFMQTCGWMPLATHLWCSVVEIA